MKIMSMTFQTTSTGNWGFVYEVINPGLIDFAAHQLRYKAVQVLRNGNASRIPILQITNKKSIHMGSNVLIILPCTDAVLPPK
jgi:hypothetical protein